MITQFLNWSLSSICSFMHYIDDQILATQILQKQYQAHVVHAAIDYQMLQ